jgi:hypothetical protein
LPLPSDPALGIYRQREVKQTIILSGAEDPSPASITGNAGRDYCSASSGFCRLQPYFQKGFFNPVGANTLSTFVSVAVSSEIFSSVKRDEDALKSSRG